jgi:hypothetical protein
MDRRCGTHRVEEECICYFGGKARRKEEDLDVRGRITLKWSLER